MGETGAARARGGLPLALRVLLVIGFAVAVGATALVVFANDVQMLRLAAVLALWAALIAAFAVTRSRRDARAAAMREGEAQLAYQLELHREVAARREYEADLSQQVASAQADQLAELRGQLERLTGVLSSLVDGEVMVSRLTLSAESARFRPGLAGQQRAAVLAGAPSPVTTIGGGSPEGDPVEPGWIESVAIPEDDQHGAAAAPVPSAPGVPAENGWNGSRAESPSASWSRRHAEWARDRDRAASAAVAALDLEAVQQHPVPARDADGDEDAGEHESGVSVADLLAAYGLAGQSRRRRRD